MPLNGIAPSSVLSALSSTEVDALGYSIQGEQVVTDPQPFVDVPSTGTTKDTQARTFLSSVQDVLLTHGLMQEEASA
jgi:hypothetical protein